MFDKFPSEPQISHLQSLKTNDKDTLFSLWMILGYELSKLDSVPGKITIPQDSKNQRLWSIKAILELLS